jgi:hypothetical protein
VNYFKSAVIGCLMAMSVVGSLQAQWNAIAGYMVSSADADPVNLILQAYNLAHKPTLPFTEIRILHGFTAGVRYHYPLGAFEMVYNRRFTRRIGDGFQIDSLPAVRTNADFYYEIRTFSYTAEFGKTIRIGGSIDYNTYLSELKYEDPKYQDFKIKQHSFGSHLFLGTHLANRHNLSFSVRAYYQFIWDNISSRSLRSRLKLLEDDCTGCDFKPGTFGLAIIINNGPQRK